MSRLAAFWYDGSFRYPSRFLFDAEQDNLEYVVPLDPQLREETLRRCGEEDAVCRTPERECIGRRVSHPVFGAGTVIGLPQDMQGLLVQFDAVVTPRTLGASAKIEFLT